VGKIIAVYCRVSTKKQDLRSQLPELKHWAKLRQEELRWDIEPKRDEIQWYEDEFTGTVMQRPGWDRLMQQVRMNRVREIVVWRLDRLGRTAKGLTALFDELHKRGVGLVSLRDGLELSTPAGRLMANMLASVAQFETEIRAERILAGQAAARVAGKRWGGSRKGERRKITDEQLAAIRTMHGEGRSVSGIARATGLSRVTVYHWLPESAPAESEPAEAIS
jgi:DNA invertase Pin-like site-specific DNA recombinase